ncbi:Ribitol 2-dehydrogenase [Bacillus cereus Rock3-28]|nr:Ribitol 2-dehydrogenase [Bacillus cereus Rock3-28]
MDLKGKIALVTGAAQGIGAAVVKALAELGVSVVAVDKNEEVLDRMAKKLQKKINMLLSFEQMLVIAKG